MKTGKIAKYILKDSSLLVSRILDTPDYLCDVLKQDMNELNIDLKNWKELIMDCSR